MSVYLYFSDYHTTDKSVEIELCQKLGLMNVIETVVTIERRKASGCVYEIIRQHLRPMIISLSEYIAQSL